MQQNALSKQSYKGQNQDLLEVARLNKGYYSNEWVTFVQAKKIGRQVKKGEHGIMLARVVDVDKMKNGKIVATTTIKRFFVFNIEQTEEANSIEE